jgi:hypothetical protein
MTVEGGIMVSHCINPACDIEFKFFNSGYLYTHERQSANMEYFWLCSPCAIEFMPSVDSNGCVSVKSRSGSQGLPPPRTEGYLRLVASPMRRIPWSAAIPAGLRRPA